MDNLFGCKNIVGMLGRYYGFVKFLLSLRRKSENCAAMAEKNNGYNPGGKILVVDDEADIREILQFNLENAGYPTDTASSAEEALEMLSPEHSLILLDVMMGGMSGFRMAEILRKERHSGIPVIFLTARSTENDLLTGFSAGCDDYVSKPFSVQEVLARVRAVLRRSGSDRESTPKPQIGGEGVRLDPLSKMVYVDGRPLALSKKEFELLSLLARHPGRIFSREEIIAQLWSDAPCVLDRTVDVHIARIRSKLGERRDCISNRSGFGYAFQESGQ